MHLYLRRIRTRRSLDCFYLSLRAWKNRTVYEIFHLVYLNLCQGRHTPPFSLVLLIDILETPFWRYFHLLS